MIRRVNSNVVWRILRTNSRGVINARICSFAIDSGKTALRLVTLCDDRGLPTKIKFTQKLLFTFAVDIKTTLDRHEGMFMPHFLCCSRAVRSRALALGGTLVARGQHSWKPGSTPLVPMSLSSRAEPRCAI